MTQSVEGSLPIGHADKPLILSIDVPAAYAPTPDDPYRFLDIDGRSSFSSLPIQPKFILPAGVQQPNQVQQKPPVQAPAKRNPKPLVSENINLKRGTIKTTGDIQVKKMSLGQISNIEASVKAPSQPLSVTGRRPSAQTTRAASIVAAIAASIAPAVKKLKKRKVSPSKSDRPGKAK